MLPWKSLLCLNCTSGLNSLFNMFISLSTSLQQIYHVEIDLRGSGNKARKYEVYQFRFNMELIVWLTATLFMYRNTGTYVHLCFCILQIQCNVFWQI